MEFAQKIRSYRQINHWTQQEVANKLTVSRKTISSWENGRSYPDIFMLVRISDLYQVSLDNLLREDRKMMNNYHQEHIADKKRDRDFCSCYRWNAFASLFYLLNLFNVLPQAKGVFSLVEGGVAGAAIVNLSILLTLAYWTQMKREQKVSFVLTLAITMVLMVALGILLSRPSGNINYISGIIAGRLVGEFFTALCLTSLACLYPQYKERRN